ncbi:MAG: hypothetical protein R3D60_07650 [Paracoccaceae bacterium]
MRFHPAVLMLIVWCSAFAAFIILPFEFVHRSIEVEGVMVLVLNLGVFVLGGLMRTVYLPQHPVIDPTRLQMRRADLLLKALALLACATMGLEVVRGGSLDLTAAYSTRSDQAQAMLNGALSQSSGIFKIGFICYPAGYIFLVRSVLLDAKPKWTQVIIFGVLPGVLAGLAMGGRAPIFNTMAYGFLAYMARGWLYQRNRSSDAPKVRKVNPLIKIGAIVGGVVAFNYFINVFIVRAEVVGGADLMLSIAATQWGVTFGGPGAEFMISIFGPVTTYLIFVFAWYLVQGVVMSNSLFMNYGGDALMGVYGIDILTAIMRRIDPAGVSNGFNYLLNLDTYGFFPSAFGTLYVDFLYGGLVFAFVWGWLAGVVYRNIRRGLDPRWFIFAPFVTLGVIFSLINTPIGFSNGFITHFWLVVTFLLIRRPRAPMPARA